MALANMKSPFPAPGTPDPGAFDPTKIATQMQTDPNVRTMFAQFFSDPASRHFVQDSGDISSALARPDNPWTPGAPVVAAPADATAQPSFASAAGPSGEPGATPGASLASRAPVGMPAAAGTPPGSPQAPGVPPTYATAHDYGVAHPEDVSVAPRPVAPMDNVHGARKALLLAFLGLNKFGAGLDHQQSSYADEFLGRQLSQSQAQSQYDVSAPQLKHQAEEAAYNNYLGQQERAGGIAHTAAETTNLQMNVPLQQAAAKEYDDLLGHWQNRDVPDFGAYAKAKLAGMPPAIAQIVQSRLGSIYQIPQTGKGYTINMQDDLPTSINVYGKDYDPKDPALAKLPVGAAAIEDFNRALAAHGTKIKEQRDTAANAAEIQGTAQSRGFSQASTMQQSAAQIATEQKGREAMAAPLGDLRSAQSNDQLISQLAGAKDEASRTALADQMAQAFAPAGSKRISPITIDQVVGMGSLSQEAGVKLKKWIEGGGPLPEESVPDLVAVAKTLNAAKLKTANDTLEDIHSIYGVKHPKAGPNGRLDEVQTPAGGGGPQAKVATSQHIADYAAKKYPNDPQGVAKATAEFKSAGYTIQ